MGGGVEVGWRPASCDVSKILAESGVAAVIAGRVMEGARWVE